MKSPASLRAINRLTCWAMQQLCPLQYTSSKERWPELHWYHGKCQGPRANRFYWRSYAVTVAVVALLAAVSPVSAGPPFRTDDPEPVDYRHSEFYAATQYENDKGSLSGTAPHFELKYGAASDVQFHLIIPNAYSMSKGGPTLFGLGNTEVGVKYRFIQESEYVPMMANTT
jgi:hypothetical protein